MKFAKDFVRGITCYMAAHRVIRENHFWPYLVIPGILSLIYIGILIVVGVMKLPGISDYINAHWIPGFLSGSAMATITAVFLWIFLLFIAYMTYKHVILILLSPILSYLSERTETVVYQRPSPPFSLKQVTKDLIRGIIINVRNLVISLVLMFLAWLLVFIPVVGAVVSMVLIFVIQSYYGGFGLFDYTLERKRYSVRESIRFGAAHRSLVTGVGTGFLAMMFIPLVGWFVGPTYGTVAATLVALEEMERKGDGQTEA